ncbi:MAG TPA: hypothetical protein VIF63_08750, partial [Candidatus Limnocylindrales bacterium]
ELRLAPQLATRGTATGALYGYAVNAAPGSSLALSSWSTFGPYTYALASPLSMTDPQGMLTGLGFGVITGIVLAPVLAAGIGLGAGIVVGLAIGVGAALLIGEVVSNNSFLNRCSPGFFGAPDGDPFFGSAPAAPPVPPAPAPLPPDPGLDSGYEVQVSAPDGGGAPIKG